MEIFGRELTIEHVIGFVRCNATPNEDLIHRAALELAVELEASQRRERAAVEDLYEACRRSPCNSGICVKKNCSGNIIPCEFEWRGPEQEGE